MPEQSFEVTLSADGVYDYFCQPHEMAGMAGRIIVGTPPKSGFWSAPQSGVPEPVLATLPRVEDILKAGQIARPG